MSGKTKSYKKNSKSKRETSALLLLPLMAVVGVVPLFVRLYAYDCGLEYFDFFRNWTMIGVGLAIFRNLRKSDIYAAKIPKEKAA